MTRIFRVVEDVSAKTRRRFHFLVLLLWVGPGAVLSWFYMTSLKWIVFMSWFACVYAAVSAWAAETPVEPEVSSDGSASLVPPDQEEPDGQE